MSYSLSPPPTFKLWNVSQKNILSVLEKFLHAGDSQCAETNSKLVAEEELKPGCNDSVVQHRHVDS